MGGRAVKGTGLDQRQGRKSVVGSNPTHPPGLLRPRRHCASCSYVLADTDGSAYQTDQSCGVVEAYLQTFSARCRSSRCLPGSATTATNSACLRGSRRSSSTACEGVRSDLQLMF